MNRLIATTTWGLDESQIEDTVVIQTINQWANRLEDHRPTISPEQAAFMLQSMQQEAIINELQWQSLIMMTPRLWK